MRAFSLCVSIRIIPQIQRIHDQCYTFHADQVEDQAEDQSRVAISLTVVGSDNFGQVALGDTIESRRSDAMSFC